MKTLKSVLITAVFLVASACTTEQPPASLEVSKSVAINAALDSVWAYAGDFCAIATWHPIVEACETTEEDGSSYRVLTLADGATIKERRDGATAAGYAYTIIEGPLPVQDYSASFQAEGDAEVTTVTWSSTFLAAGVTDAAAQDLISGIYADGLAAIADNFNQ